MSFAVLRIVGSLIEVGILRNATAGGGDLHVFSTVASYPRPRVVWATDTEELAPVDKTDLETPPW